MRLRRVVSSSKALFLSLLAVAVFPTLAEPQKLWTPTGVPAAPFPPAYPNHPLVLGMNGGAYVAWTDTRTYSTTDFDVAIQKLLPDGTIAPGWPMAGLLISTVTRAQRPAAIISDGSGGALVFWSDSRNVPPAGNGDLYGLRVLSDGSLAPGWAVGGSPICTAPNSQSSPTALPDGSGGAIVVWNDLRNVPIGGSFHDIYSQHVTGTGTLDPLWPATGLSICTETRDQSYPQIITDGMGGAIIAWDDSRGSTAEVFGLRVNLDGTVAPGWAANGNLLVDAPNHQSQPWIVPDGTGGALVAFQDLRSDFGDPDPYYADINIYAIRVTAGGAVAPGWPAGGVPITTTPHAQERLVACTDGAGGMFVAWNGHSGGIGGVSRIQGDGALAPGWPLNGKPYAIQEGDVNAIVPDGMGGAYLAWYGGDGAGEVFAQHLTPDGNPVVGWPAAGISMVGGPATRQTAMSMSPDGLGGAIIVWEDFRPPINPGGSSYKGIYAQRLGIGGPTPVLISLTGVEVEAGRVRLTWYAPQGPGLTATVERRTEQGEWVPLGPPKVLSDGTIRFEDRTVSPGTRYGYRLRYGDGTGVGYSDVTWVEVPRAARFALRGLSPNPSAGDAMVALSLASHEAAGLEVYDISGRLVSSRELGSLGPGPHELRLAERGQLAAGVYSVRLRQGGQIASARAVVIR